MGTLSDSNVSGAQRASAETANAIAAMAARQQRLNNLNQILEDENEGLLQQLHSTAGHNVPPSHATIAALRKELSDALGDNRELLRHLRGESAKPLADIAPQMPSEGADFDAAWELSRAQKALQEMAGELAASEAALQRLQDGAVRFGGRATAGDKDLHLENDILKRDNAQMAQDIMKLQRALTRNGEQGEMQGRRPALELMTMAEREGAVSNPVDPQRDNALLQSELDQMQAALIAAETKAVMLEAQMAAMADSVQDPSAVSEAVPENVRAMRQKRQRQAIARQLADKDVSASVLQARLGVVLAQLEESQQQQQEMAREFSQAVAWNTRLHEEKEKLAKELDDARAELAQLAEDWKSLARSENALHKQVRTLSSSLAVLIRSDCRWRRRCSSVWNSIRHATSWECPL